MKGESMSKEDFKIGDRVKFIKGFRKGTKGTLLGLKDTKDSSFSIGGIPWYSIKLDGGYGYVISGQFEGELRKISDIKNKRKKVKA